MLSSWELKGELKLQAIKIPGDQALEFRLLMTKSSHKKTKLIDQLLFEVVFFVDYWLCESTFDRRSATNNMEGYGD